MTLRDDVIDYIVASCAKEGLETRPRIGVMASELNSDKDEVIEIVKGLEKEGFIEYVTDTTGGGESHVCPAISPEELYTRRIVELVNEKGKVDVDELHKCLALDKHKISELADKLAKEGKIKFAEGNLEVA
ncbi:MAG: hypothetical protein ACLFVX_01205 [Archaeoglobaceae archaeon]